MIDLEEQLGEYLAVSSSWRGQGEAMTIGQGIKRLSPIIYQSSSKVLSERARLLMHEIIVGRPYTHTTRNKEAV